MAFKQKGFPAHSGTSIAKQKLRADGTSIFSPKKSEENKAKVKVLKPGDKGYVAPPGISKDDKTVYKQYSKEEKAQHKKDAIALHASDTKAQGGRKNRDYEDAVEYAKNDYDTDKPTPSQIKAALAKMKL